VLKQPTIISGDFVLITFAFFSTTKQLKEVFAHIHSLDSTRPVTVINFNGRHGNEGGEYIDIIGFNYFSGWSVDVGKLDVVVNNVLKRGQHLRSEFNKPIMITEYGTDTLEGLHMVQNSLLLDSTFDRSNFSFRLLFGPKSTKPSLSVFISKLLISCAARVTSSER
jgi:hypothetical protein